MSTIAVLDVAVAILRDADGRVLINERLGDDVHTGHWEFPGGKFEQGESPRQALQRECMEELGISVSESKPLITFTHAYPEKSVRLHVFSIVAFSGQPSSLEGQPLRWVEINQLDAHNLLPADVAIINALKIPQHCFVTPKLSVAIDLNRIVHSVDRHFSMHDELMLQIRQHHMASEEYQELTSKLVKALALVKKPQKKLLIQLNTSLDVFASINLTEENLKLGLHLTASRLKQLKRSQLPYKRDLLIGASVHNEEEINLGIKHDLDYLTLGMVNPSDSHPNREAIHWSGFSRLVKDRPIPIFAIGGMDLNQTLHARENGARGIAGIRMFL